MKVFKSIITIVAILAYGLLYYLWLPPLSISYYDGFIFFAIGIMEMAFIIALWKCDFKDDSGFISKFYGIATFIIILLGIFILKTGMGFVCIIAIALWKFFKSLFEDVYEFFYKFIMKIKKPIKVFTISAIILFAINLIVSFAGSRFFNSSSMHNQIGKIEKKDFVQDIVEIDNSQIPIVDIKLAAKLADKKMGGEAAMGSQMEVGQFTNKQQVNGKLIYVAPLEHRSLLKWNSNKSGTDGYIVVNSTNTNDVKMVKELDGQQIKLKYLQSAYFSSNLKRHIRLSGFRTKGLTEYTFELDDKGYPYWVVTTYHNTTLWGNPEADGVVICDAQTGECKWYSIKDTPEWVDIIQPEDFIKNQLKNYGEYVNGWFNPSDKGKLSVTKHITTVYNDGDCYYYTGMSSVGKDDATVGFMMVNTRDKSVTYYKKEGATESAAMNSAKGIVQEKKYSATTPIPLNISGIPTYFLTLKDDEGLIKSYAMINIEHYEIYGIGSTIMEAKRDYMNAINTNGNNIAFSSDEVYGYTVKGKVSRISANIEAGNTSYYMILDNDRTKLYVASYTISEELPITRLGDTVEISYIDESNGSINIVTFDNLDFSQEISSDQVKKSEAIIEEPENKITDVDEEEINSKINSLTTEEKAKLLKDYNK